MGFGRDMAYEILKGRIAAEAEENRVKSFTDAGKQIIKEIKKKDKDKVQQLIDLKRLRDDKVITAREFAKLKKELLNETKDKSDDGDNEFCDSCGKQFFLNIKTKCRGCSKVLCNSCSKTDANKEIFCSDCINSAYEQQEKEELREQQRKEKLRKKLRIKPEVIQTYKAWNVNKWVGIGLCFTIYGAIVGVPLIIWSSIMRSRVRNSHPKIDEVI